MSVGEDIRAELVADAAVAALVGARIYPVAAPQGAPLPFVVYTVVSFLPVPSFDGTAQSRPALCRVQVDAYAQTYRDAQGVGTAVDSVLGNLLRPELNASLDVSRDDFDVEGQAHRVSMEFSVFWAPPE